MLLLDDLGTVAPEKARSSSRRSPACAMDTMVFVTDVPMLAPIMMGIAYFTETWPAQDRRQNADHQTCNGIVHNSKQVTRTFASQHKEGAAHHVQSHQEEVDRGKHADDFESRVEDELPLALGLRGISHGGKSC